MDDVEPQVQFGGTTGELQTKWQRLGLNLFFSSDLRETITENQKKVNSFVVYILSCG